MNEKFEKSDPKPELIKEEAGCEANEPYALRVLGDSMEPEFPDGCVVIIEPSTHAEIGNYVIADLEDEGLIFRQLTARDGEHFLTPVNQNYQPIAIENLQAIRGIIIQKSTPRSRRRKHYL